MRVRLSSVAIAAITCLAVGGWSCFPTQGAGAVSKRSGVATILAVEGGAQANRQAAEREAQHLVTLARVPPGATRLNDARACSTAAAEMTKPAETSVVRKSRFWRVSESWDTASLVAPREPSGRVAPDHLDARRGALGIRRQDDSPMVLGGATGGRGSPKRV